MSFTARAGIEICGNKQNCVFFTGQIANVYGTDHSVATVDAGLGGDIYNLSSLLITFYLSGHVIKGNGIYWCAFTSNSNPLTISNRTLSSNLAEEVEVTYIMPLA